MIKATTRDYPYSPGWQDLVQRYAHGIGIPMGATLSYITDYIQFFQVKAPVTVDHPKQKIEYVIKHNAMPKDLLQIELKHFCELLSNITQQNLICDYIPVIHADFNAVLVIEYYTHERFFRTAW